MSEGIAATCEDEDADTSLPPATTRRRNENQRVSRRHLAWSRHGGGATSDGDASTGSRLRAFIRPKRYSRFAGKRGRFQECAESEYDPYSEPEREFEPAESRSWLHHSSVAMRTAELRGHTRHTRVLGSRTLGHQSERILNEKHFISLYSHKYLLSGILWLAKINDEYGMRLMLLLFASQHTLKGIVQQFQASSVMWLLRGYRVSGPQMQLYMSMSNSAWALKPIIGLISDLFPLFGYRKAPYVILTSCIGVLCAARIGFSSRETTTVGCVVACLFGMHLQCSTTDLLTEATYSERIQQKPHMGPDLITYVWGGITLGNMVTVSFVSLLISNFGPRASFLACIAPCAAVIYPSLMNYFDEVAYTRQHLAKVRAAFLKQREVLFLCVLMTFLTIVLTIFGTSTRDYRVQFVGAISILFVLVLSTNLLLRPEIARVNSFFMIQAALSVNINGATFYFYTDTVEQYPEGPHFTPWFFTTALGLVASVMSLVGLAIYTTYMKSWTYRSLLLLSNILITVLGSLDMLMFRRLNVQWGVSDRLFVLGSSVSTVVIKQWQWMPGVVVMSQLCPTGMEATMFALLAGCTNLGNQIADFLGAWLLAMLEVHPTGAVNETHEFINLWKASCVATLLPGVTIALIPLLMPRHRQTERLLFHSVSSATAGSPWSRWFNVTDEEANASQTSSSASSNGTTVDERTLGCTERA
eukprot:TRINITY_DN55093_c0_g1_i1.p1 TRINITY_DN55093_c0_g1~~TRINITY_DN55093_c0_g1_i1.p1  ORF type:complete len:699 (-),score=52.26 TRINITY_DN55093_c0_g1_i1:144-2240(-)